MDTHVGVVPIGGFAFGLAGTRFLERDRDLDFDSLCEWVRGRGLERSCMATG